LSKVAANPAVGSGARYVRRSDVRIAQEYGLAP
jgi:hypothetical protein